MLLKINLIIISLIAFNVKLMSIFAHEINYHNIFNLHENQLLNNA